MPIIYNDLSELINKTTWDVWVSDMAEIHIPYYYQKFPERRPLYSVNEGMALGKFTIDNIVNFCNDGVVFGIKERKDFISICEYLRQYMESLATYLVDQPETSPYVIYNEKCRKALVKLEEINEVATFTEKAEQLDEPHSASDIIAALGHI